MAKRPKAKKTPAGKKKRAPARPRRPAAHAREVFVAELLKNGGNATQAYAAAHPRASYRTCRTEGSRLLAHPDIQRRVAGQIHRAQVTAEQVIGELAAEAFFDPAALYDKEGRLKPIHDMPQAARKALCQLESSRTEVPDTDIAVVVDKVKFTNKIRALELLGKHLGLFTEKVEHEGQVNFVIETGIPRAPGGNDDDSDL